MQESIPSEVQLGEIILAPKLLDRNLYTRLLTNHVENFCLLVAS